MDTNFSIADSTDWLGTTLAAFAPLESALRCQVCKDFFDTPMMTSCSHTFCSLCIRRCFAADGRCPTCRAADQDSKLRRNWTAQELVDSFQAARPQALELARKDAASIKSASGHDEGKRTRRGGNNKGVKRKLEVRDSEDEEELDEGEAARRPAHLGIPQSGTRAQQIRRHTEWANLWNANVDSLRPRTKRELLSELDRWERSQTMESGGIVGGSSGAQVMKKDFDGDGWAKNNKSHFDELIASARSKRAASKGQASEEDKPVATNGTSSSAEDRGSHQPYEDEAALDKVRSSVDNAARGAPSLPHRNSNAMEESSGTPNPNNPTQNSTVYGQTVASPSSKSPTRDNQDKAPSSLLRRIASPSSELRKVPMFELPSEPIRDVDTELGK
ncbi:Zinc finger RING-type protein [Neofusicoccum parvum]|nr:Zinc finger RING-type protein [Neofusicoccum parvum]